MYFGHEMIHHMIPMTVVNILRVAAIVIIESMWIMVRYITGDTFIVTL